MRLICAWCKEAISEENSSKETTPEISHGICPACRSRFFPGIPFQDIPRKEEKAKEPDSFAVPSTPPTATKKN